MPTSIGLRWYQTGTVSVTQGSTTLTGVGTNWAGAGIKAGDIFTIDNSVLYEVLTVNSNTDITLATAFAGVTGETLNYSIIRNFAATMQAEIAAQVALLVNKYETYIDTELEQIVGPKGDPGLVYKGVWQAERNYDAMDVVLYNTVLYVAKVPHISSAENAPGTLGSVWADTLINVPTVINDLTTGGADAALSAQMGVTLQNTKFDSSAAGDMTLLNTTAKSTFVSAINEVLGDVGTLSSLNTTAKSSAVAAINEVLGDVGTLSSLNTTAKGSAVSAINEVLGDVGTLSSLDTTAKSSAVSAINEVNTAVGAVDTKVGTLSSLTTTDKTDTVSAINEVNNAAGAVDTKVGDLNNLVTDEKTNIVSAINYVYLNSHPLHPIYGYRIKKSEPDPYFRVEYLYDAAGMIPAYMDYTGGVFRYGSWGDKWFVTDNKPLMLRSDGTVGYYLNPNDYTKKADGTASDVTSTSYDGNAMAQFPLVWVKRWEDSDYLYEAISDIQQDNDYKAYAHTRADGTIADYFYWSMFGGSGSSSKIRSLSGQTLAKDLTAAQVIAGCQANGAKWYLHTWSQRELIRTLLVLMGKSTNTQAVFGNGNSRGSTAGSTNIFTTGTLKDKGQFFGYTSNNQQVKVFHIEKFWGDQWDRTAGLINNSGSICVKMTPEGSGYRVTDVTGYTDSGVTITGTTGGYISAATCSELGIIPTVVSGSGSTYYCDGSWFDNSQLDYLAFGGSALNVTSEGGAFTLSVASAPSYTAWTFGCGLSCEMPAAE